jgi:hypothetical protein
MRALTDTGGTVLQVLIIMSAPAFSCLPVSCKQIGSATHLPDVLYFRGQLAAREVASGDFTFLNRMESGFVCGTAGWGFRNFLRITDWDSEAALRRFFYDGKIHLRCSIDQCE